MVRELVRSENTVIHISLANIFLYKGVTIDWHSYCGPVILNRHTDRERPSVSLRVCGLVGQFIRLSDEEREQYRIF